MRVIDDAAQSDSFFLESRRLHRLTIGMTKTENRAAAKAYHRERMQRHRNEAHALAVAADLEELRRLRHYLIFGTRAGVPAMDLLDALDDYAELLTGDRNRLHVSHQSIGGR
jgi:predicted O-methyltransferase YrrM